MKKLFNNIYILFFIFALFFNAPSIAFADDIPVTSSTQSSPQTVLQTSKKSSSSKTNNSSKTKNPNCRLEQAKIYFADAENVIASYSPEYYCSDILFLINFRDGQNIPLDEYKQAYKDAILNNIDNEDKAFYQKEVNNFNFDYLRQVGITPNLLATIAIGDFASDDEDQKELRKDKIGFTTKNEIINSIKEYVNTMRTDANYVIVTNSIFEPEEELIESEEIGAILNKEKHYRECFEQEDTTSEVENSLYSNSSSNYGKFISALPPALAPVVLDGNRFINAFGQTVAVLKDNRALGKGKRQVVFNSSNEWESPGVFGQSQVVTIDWNEKVCRSNSIIIKEMIDRNSTCYLCPYIIMMFNEISYLFDYMYTNFSDIILVFLIVFGALWMVFEFLKGFNNLPFSADFSSYPKSVAKKLQKIIIVCTIFLVPPQTLFSWTVAPVMDLTVAISDSILEANGTGSTTSQCNANTVVDDLNELRKNELDEIATPPIVKVREANDIEKMEDSYIIPKDTMGKVICFLTDTLRANGRQMTIGQVLMVSTFLPSTKYSLGYRIGCLLLGIIIFGLYFLINIMISFYVLDGLIQFLLIAITWPIAVFGYAFDVIGIKVSVSTLINTTKQYGLVLINLSIFTLFNAALLNTFYFMNMDQHTYEVLKGENLDILKDKDNEGIPFNAPVDSNVYVMTSDFGDRSDPFKDESDIHASSEFHTGIDFAVPEWTPIPASAKGRVVQAGQRGNYGNAVEVQHEGGFSTVYGHLNQVKVAVGDIVDSNTIIGLSGSTGRSTGPHLHYEVRYNGKVINPLTFTNRRETISEIITRAEEENDISVIVNSIPTDFASVLKFLFIIYCIYYIYANLGVLAATYGGVAGSTPIGNAARKIVTSTIKTVTSVNRGTPSGYYIKSNKKSEKKGKNDSSGNGGSGGPPTPSTGGNNA